MKCTHSHDHAPFASESRVSNLNFMSCNVQCLCGLRPVVQFAILFEVPSCASVAIFQAVNETGFLASSITNRGCLLFQEFTVDIFLRQRWVDDRLTHKSLNETVTLNYKRYDSLWVPDLFVTNMKRGAFQTVTVPNRLLRLSPDGTVYYSQRYVMYDLILATRLRYRTKCCFFVQHS